MATMDIFKSDAFSMVQLTEAIQKVGFQPQRLGQLGLFTPQPVRTESIAIEKREGTLRLIKSDERGAPLAQRTTEKRDIRNFRTVRLAKGDRITASEIQNIRAFGSETELMQVQGEVARRLAGPLGLVNDMELTWEHMRLGAVQGIVLDADGSVLNNWFDAWGVAQPAELDFDLDAASPAPGALRKKCDALVRSMLRSMRGLGGPGTTIHALVGDAFWDDLVNHPEVRETYLNYEAAAALREGTAFGQGFRFGGITWENYRGTDDNSTVAVGVDKAHFFPVNAPGLFQVAFSPAETFDYVNTPGLPMYSMTVPDNDRNMWVDIEVYSYPLFYCTRPEVLRRGKRT